VEWWNNGLRDNGTLGYLEISFYIEAKNALKSETSFLKSTFHYSVYEAGIETSKNSLALNKF
jgi:hypothetical protein